MEVKGFEVEGVIKIDNVRIYGLNESVIASGYPMQIETHDMNKVVIGEKDLKRVKHLGNAVPGSGHDCFAKGITVQFDLQVPEYIWRQLDRYHFIDYVSSQSKMHRILKMDIDEACNKYVLQETIDSLNELIGYYNNFDREVEKCKEDYPNEPLRYKLRDETLIEGTKENLFNIIIANTPCGLMLTARMTTNYLQLKSIVNQRSNHKMQEWRLLCDYFKTLPMFDLVCK
jgi:hypothetical protein